ILRLSLGLAAWKGYDAENRWAVRCNPSSGNLHPTEGYIVVGDLPGLPGGVYHYRPKEHALERRMTPSADFTKRSFGRLFVALSSIHWREEWKYGMRAFRYCQHDVGHAVAAFAYAAAGLGWQARHVANVADATVARLVGLDRAADFDGAERESPDLILQIEPGRGHLSKVTVEMVDALADAAMNGAWQGRANPLSPRHLHTWPAVEEVSDATMKPSTDEKPWSAPPPKAVSPTDCVTPAVPLILGRRPVQRFDGRTPLSARSFFRILDMTQPRQKVVPFDTLPWRPFIDLALFVHNVEGVTPGLYALVRDAEGFNGLKADLSAEFAWAAVEGAPSHLPLFRLAAADLRRDAMTLSCRQEIAGLSAFSLGMLARMDDALAPGPWGYRRLYWEAGMIGQVLYLEAEAAGVRGTGIGCFHDDEVHRLLGLTGPQRQSIYHFTVGTPVEDARLRSDPPYLAE
ncbi:MAG: SagB/ThcOx family dehydrogenase, partial [Nitrospinae bacterium]|nr:SagB/ThcOx family dehydrogenase [Nitrospinota bacterium]